MKLTKFLTDAFGRNPQTHRRKPRGVPHADHSLPAVVAEVQELEDRLVLSPGILAIGVGSGSVSRVNVFDAQTGSPLFQFDPYPESPLFLGGVRVATGYVPDISGSPVLPVVITAPGPGLLSNTPVRVFSAVAGTLSTGRPVGPGELIGTTDPYPGFGGGIHVATADFDRDGFTDIITGAGRGGGPHVRVISGQNGFILFDQFVYNPLFTGGVRVGAGQITPGDNFPELITGAGPGGGPHVKVFNGFNGVQLPGAAGSFFAYSPLFTGGVYVAAGDFDGEGLAEIVTGAGAGGGPHVRIIPPFGPNPSDPAFDLNRFTLQFPYDPSFTGGVRVGAAYIDSDLIADLVVARGPGGTADAIVFNGPTAAVLYSGPSFVNPAVFTGSFPAVSKFPLEPLRLEDESGTRTEPAAAISTQDVQPVFDAALTRLQEMGVPQDLIDELDALQIQVTDLGGDYLAIARPGSIVIDDDAVGFGWYIDPTPLEDGEFNAEGFAMETDALAHVDLLSVTLHEMGHHLGWDDLDPAINPHHLMAETFRSGERRLPAQNAVDFLFSEGDLFDRLLAPSLL